MSRPEKDIDWNVANSMLTSGCLGTEIASYFDMHPDTFYDKVFEKYKMGFSAYSQRKKMRGHGILRHKQFIKAVEKLDNTMLIWLGKQMLGQRDSYLDNDTNTEDHMKKLDEVLACMRERQSSSDLKIADSNINNEL